VIRIDRFFKLGNPDIKQKTYPLDDPDKTPVKIISTASFSPGNPDVIKEKKNKKTAKEIENKIFIFVLFSLPDLKTKYRKGDSIIMVKA
jgi:hypothetical protein